MKQYKKRGVNKLTIVGFAVVAVLLIVISFILFLPSKVEFSQAEFDFLNFHLNFCEESSQASVIACNAKKNNDLSSCDNIKDTNLQTVCRTEFQFFSATKNKNLEECPDIFPHSVICSALINNNKDECLAGVEPLPSEICNVYFDSDHINAVLSSDCNKEFEETYSACMHNLMDFEDKDGKIRDLLIDCGADETIDAVISCIELTKNEKVIIK